MSIRALNGKLQLFQDGKHYDLDHLPDGFVVKGDLNLSGKMLDRLPDLSRVEVMGRFDCSHNNLKSLKGAPKAKYFNCSFNRLNDYVGAPEEVVEFICSGNYSTTLKGSPKKARVFCCSFNDLISLEGGPEEVELLYCLKNKLLDLRGAPRKAKMIDCSYNKSMTLDGAPHGTTIIARGNPFCPEMQYIARQTIVPPHLSQAHQR